VVTRVIGALVPVMSESVTVGVLEDTAAGAAVVAGVVAAAAGAAAGVAAGVFEEEQPPTIKTPTATLTSSGVAQREGRRGV
jgi:hypothetical protein